MSLLFYFKEQPISPSKINPAEIDRIQKFRGSLGDLGGLYWPFETVADFEALIRPHLAKVIQVWKARLEAQPAGPGTSESRQITIAHSRTLSVAADEIEPDELGYLDYMEIGERANSVLLAALERMAAAIKELGTNVQKRAATATELAASPNLISAKTVANDVAADLEDFAKRTVSEIPLFSEAYADVLRAFSGAASIAVETSGGHEQVSSALSQVEQLRTALEESKPQLLFFAESLRSAPRMTTQLNRARNKALSVLASLDAELGKAQSNGILVENSIRSLLTVKSD